MICLIFGRKIIRTMSKTFGRRIIRTRNPPATNYPFYRKKLERSEELSGEELCGDDYPIPSNKYGPKAGPGPWYFMVQSRHITMVRGVCLFQAFCGFFNIEFLWWSKPSSAHGLLWSSAMGSGR
jgi:hypothetical protein